MRSVTTATATITIEADETRQTSGLDSLRMNSNLYYKCQRLNVRAMAVFLHEK